MHAIMGMLPVASGTATFAGQDVTARVPHRVARAGIALVPQGRRLFAQLTASHRASSRRWPV